MYFSVMLPHCTCSKNHLCFLATLKNIAPGFSFPILAPFISKMFTRMHCISSHGLENGSRQWHLLNIHFPPQSFAVRWRKCQFLLKESSTGTDCWHQAAGMWHTALGDEQRAALQTLFIQWNVNPAPLRGAGKLLWSRQDRVCRAWGGFMLQESQGHEKEGLWREL